MPNDNFKIFCVHCKHWWLLKSDQEIDIETYTNWYKQVVKPEHAKICKPNKKWWEFWK